MNEIDKGVTALTLYIVFAALFSFIYSLFGNSEKKQAEIAPESSQILKDGGKAKKSKIIQPGFVAFCNVCERTLENDTYLKNHLEGAKHNKKAQGFKNEVYSLVKTANKK